MVVLAAERDMMQFEHIDWIGAWKVLSIASTGAFGVLGLVTEYKDPFTKRLTRWGVVSLLGIIVSTLLGAAAQVIESNSDAAASKRRDEQLEKQLTNTRQAVGNIHRLLTPLGNPRFKLVFRDVPCEAIALQKECARARTLRDATLARVRRPLGLSDRASGWPVGGRRMGVLAIAMNGPGPKDQAFNDPDVHIVRPLEECSDLLFQSKNCDVRYGRMRITTRDGRFADITIESDLEPTKTRKPGTLVSTDDLAGGTLSVTLRLNGWPNDRAPFLQIRLAGAVCHRFPAHEFKPARDGLTNYFWMRLPADIAATTACTETGSAGPRYGS